MPPPNKWQPAELNSIERRLTEARDLLSQAAALLEARDMESIANLADMHLDEESRRNDNQNRRRYR